MTIQAIICSKDRALQLNLLLDSIKKNGNKDAYHLDLNRMEIFSNAEVLNGAK